MKIAQIVVIVSIIVIVLVIIGLVIFLLLKRKKIVDATSTDTEKLLENKKLISSNTLKLESLIFLASGEEKLQLENLQKEMKYLSPSSNEKVKEIDMEIDTILTNAKNNLVEDIMDYSFIKKVEILIRDRLVYTKK